MEDIEAKVLESATKKELNELLIDCKYTKYYEDDSNKELRSYIEKVKSLAIEDKISENYVEDGLLAKEFSVVKEALGNTILEHETILDVLHEQEQQLMLDGLNFVVEDDATDDFGIPESYLDAMDSMQTQIKGLEDGLADLNEQMENLEANYKKMVVIW